MPLSEADLLASSRVCSRCGIDQPRDQYTDRAWTRDKGAGSYVCRPCRAEQNRQDKYLRKYGITIEDYERMLEEQDGHCALCLREPYKPRRALMVDHDHETMEIRGLLCYQCNTALGALGDNEAGLIRALAYVKGG